MNTFKWLVKREYWEHRGGFMWTPFWVTTAVLILTILGITWTEVAGRRVTSHLSFGIPWDQLSAQISSGDLVQAGQGLDVIYVMFNLMVCVSLFFVLFFYLLGALYDDRKDRSVLFWKSLPVSDTATVLSKVATAAVLAPLIAFAIATVAYVGFLLVVSIWASLHGINPLPVIANSNPFGMFWRLLLTVPVNALWALPALGWLLLCSAFARSKPFLWAVLIPLLAVILNGWVSAMGLPSFSSKFLSNDVAGRMIFSIIPGSWIDKSDVVRVGEMASSGSSLDGARLVNALNPAHVYAVFGQPAMWIGIAAGVVMIAATIWMRRRRIESSV
ncbi:MAG: hypothetical protein ABIP56_00075 [Dokdonella sp.]